VQWFYVKILNNQSNCDLLNSKAAGSQCDLTTDYCDVVWMPSSTLLFKRLERLNSKFSNLKSATSRSSMAITLAQRRCYHTAIQVYRSLHKISPSYLYNTFHYAAEITGRDAHNEHCLFVPRVRTSLAKNS